MRRGRREGDDENKREKNDRNSSTPILMGWKANKNLSSHYNNGINREKPADKKHEVL